MSRMVEIDLQIQELLDEGLKPISVAGILHVPLEMVYDVVERELADEPDGVADMMSYDELFGDDYEIFDKE